MAYTVPGNRSSQRDGDERRHEKVLRHLGRSEFAEPESGIRFSMWRIIRLLVADRGRVQQVVFAVAVVRKLLLATKCKQAMLPVTGGRGLRRLPGQCAVAQWVPVRA